MMIDPGREWRTARLAGGAAGIDYITIPSWESAAIARRRDPYFVSIVLTPSQSSGGGSR